MSYIQYIVFFSNNQNVVVYCNWLQAVFSYRLHIFFQNDKNKCLHSVIYTVYNDHVPGETEQHDRVSDEIV